MEGSESINVPNDLADIGGDMGPGVQGDKAGIGETGGKGDLGSLVLGRGDGGRPEKRCCGVTKLLGESSDGSLGMPWLDKGEYSVREPERLWLPVVGPAVDDMDSERADSAGDRVGSMVVCRTSLGWSMKG